MKKIGIENLESLRLGATILGSGGGGNPSHLLPMVRYQMEKYGPCTLITHNELKDTDFIVPLAFIGAPLINKERLICQKELDAVIETISLRIQKPTVLMPGEIGGANALVPFLIASKLGLRILDADIVGRAFPKLEMNTANIYGMEAAPAVLADCHGNTVLLDALDAVSLERIARANCICMGSSSAMGLYMMNKKQAQVATVIGSITKAIEIGNALREATSEAFRAFKALEKSFTVKYLGSGVISHVDQHIDKGFLKGFVKIDAALSSIYLQYQNEYLFAYQSQELIASTPDILVLLDTYSQMPISSDQLKYGQEVELLSLQAPKIWTTQRGLSLAGPDVFLRDMMEVFV